MYKYTQHIFYNYIGGGSTGQTPLESGGTMRSTASSTTDGELTVPRSILRKRQKDTTRDTNLSRNRGTSQLLFIEY